ncbi:hypothetical protein SAV14893_052040 [Streptomyces avermitilis]|uniref:Uncharacterized protein n=1 Tax=Streptomyces avermitilis TaxID=33903 RepID=A0A4D4M1W1_STRAX|nr:hypothetical protein SAV14893_052040 [Streptomyces avermitilis]
MPADLVAVLLQRGQRRGVDLRPDPGLRDGVVDGGLEVLEVEDRVRLLELHGLLGADLQVVRLLAGLGQTGDPHMLPADLLGEILHGVERRHHVELSAVPAVGRGRVRAGGERAETEKGGRGHGGPGYEASSYVHDSHFQQNWKRLSTRLLSRMVTPTDLIRGWAAPVT